MLKPFQKDPAVHRLMKKPVSSRTTPISEQAWRDHINNLFNHPSPSNNDSHGSHNKAPGGTDPRPFNLTGKVELTSLISKHIADMDISSTPGFDTILPPFINMLANRSQDTMAEVLKITMCWLHTFHNSSCSCLKRPASPPPGKLPNLHPYTKKGAATHPSNYRMLAISNTL
eukprot:1148384-Pelagomonas_calceolata.AAC.2